MPQLLFKGGYYSRVAFTLYFLGKSGDINGGWIRYVRVRRWWLLDTVSSTRSLSVLLSAVGMTRTTQTVLVLAWWLSSEIICSCVRVPRLLATATIRGQRWFKDIWYLWEFTWLILVNVLEGVSAHAHTTHVLPYQSAAKPNTSPGVTVLFPPTLPGLLGASPSQEIPIT